MLHSSLKSLIFISCFNICYGFIHLICALTDAVAALQLCVVVAQTGAGGALLCMIRGPGTKISVSQLKRIIITTISIACYSKRFFTFDTLLSLNYVISNSRHTITISLLNLR